MSVSTVVDPARCPLCGQANGCTMATRPTDEQQPTTTCWCASAHFSAELLARVAAAEQGQACICATCAGAKPHA